jgi:N-methylhydantoinase A
MAQTRGGDARDSEQFTLCVDIGGTFTDLILGSTATTYAYKILSTPHDYAEAVIAGTQRIIEDSGVALPRIRAVVHATTVATNAVLEHTGPKTALITTDGFKDVLELRRMRCPDPYNMDWEKPAPLVPREWRLEITERLDAAGETLIELDPEILAATVDKIFDDGEIGAIAICLLNSYRNGAHETAVLNEIRRRDGAIPVSASSDVLPEIGEYERTSTTVVDAYVKPVVQSYLGRLSAGLRDIGLSCPLYVMQSNGRCISVESAEARPSRILESGPAAGVVAAAALARELGDADVVAFDMGGTTSKASLVRGGNPAITPYVEVGTPLTIAGRAMRGGGYVVQGSAIDVAEIGTGGGSQLWIDAGGQLAVGPRSSGSRPGPVCYQAGGQVATVTDAAVVLGYVNPVALAGGGLKVRPEAAYEALAKLVPAAGASPREVAHNAFRIANSNMARAIRAVSLDRGIRLERCALVAYGGGGPVHAADLAHLLGVRQVIVPPFSGLLSAVGMGAAGVGLEFATSVWRDVESLAEGELDAIQTRLEEQATGELSRQGWTADEITLECHAELHYRGQLSQLAMDLPRDKESRRAAESALVRKFHEEHERVYGYSQQRAAVQLGSVRLNAHVDIGVGLLGRPGQAANSVQHGRRMCYFADDEQGCETDIVSRAMVGTDWQPGPLIVEEADTSVVVPHKFEVRRDDYDNLVIVTV